MEDADLTYTETSALENSFSDLLAAEKITAENALIASNFPTKSHEPCGGNSQCPNIPTVYCPDCKAAFCNDCNEYLHVSLAVPALQAHKTMFFNQNFDFSFILAQMNQTRFYSNVALEMHTMMDCCEMTELAWGSLSLLRLDSSLVDILVTASPTISIDFVEDETPVGTTKTTTSTGGVGGKAEQRVVTTLRSSSERGNDWVSSVVINMKRDVGLLRSVKVS
jgi:hypothetical protein